MKFFCELRTANCELKKSKFLRVVVFSLFVSLLLAGCHSDKPSVKIGLNTELTGEVPSIGNSCLHAAQLFVEEKNQAGGISIAGVKMPLSLVVGDNGAKPDQAATVAQRLISQDEVVAMVGPNISSCAIPAAEIAESFGCLMMTPLSTNQRTTKDSATEKAKKHVFRAGFTEVFEQLALAKFAIEQLHAKKAAILYDMSSEAPNSESKLFKKAFIAQGGTVVAMETYSTGDRDFRAQLTNIKAAEPDVIFLPTYYNDVPLIAEQAHQLGIKAIFLGNSAWSTPEIIQLDAGHHLEGACFSNHFAMESNAPEIQKFITSYKAKFGELPDEIAALTYDSISLVTQAIEKANSLDRLAISRAMGEIREFQGLTGNFIYPPGSRDPIKNVIMIQLRQGKFEQMK
ncbi:MAG: ABC transporter substrate-binding protein [Chthoniobacterales bacterium]|nr:ABC transporter substrate-binding protein [Chthoniobacterales bacterium]